MPEETTNKSQEDSLENQVPDLAQMLKEFDGAPDNTQVEKWKERYGEVFVSGFSETELFLWRPIGRAEYVGLQKKMRSVPATPEDQSSTEFEFENSIVTTCVLWSSDGQSLERKGGSVSTLSEQIMTNSNFMGSAMASVLVMKL